MSAHWCWLLGFSQNVLVQRVLPDPACRLGGALSRLARRIRRGFHVVALVAFFSTKCVPLAVSIGVENRFVVETLRLAG